ncbi:MAG TPA: hypothetical protein VLF14_04945, partial [Candidatus Binatia bacterium]|nr:hypothetical protein [Candidatus Binatia bacterium]
LPTLPAARLTVRGATRAAHGNPVELDEVDEWTASYREEPTEAPIALGAEERVRLLAPDGRLLGVAAAGERAGWPLRPAVVLV